MSSRGSLAKNGHITIDEYETVKVTNSGTKILEGIGKNHSLPDYSHTPNSIYAKMKKSGDLLSLRFYDENCNLVLEIGNHPEPKINNGKRNDVVHFHKYNGLTRDDAIILTVEMKEKYKKYLKEFNLYDKC